MVLAVAASVSSIHTAAHHRGNQATWTYIRDLSGYYWFCGKAGGANASAQWDGHMTDNSNTVNRTTPVKMMLPCDPSEIKRFLPASCDFNANNGNGVCFILTHDGRVFISGSYVNYYGAGLSQHSAEPHHFAQWIQYSF